MTLDQQEVWGRWASPSGRTGRDERTDKVTDKKPSPRDSTRVPLAHRIQLKFDRFSGFIDEYISNLSPGGIFIRTDAPEAPGSLLAFEFRLGDGFELIRGHGEVVWARQRPEQVDGKERPAGMGVRFLELSPGSKDLIYKIVDDYVAHGGKPFELTSTTGQPAAAAGVPPPAAVGAVGAAPAAPAPPAVSWATNLDGRGAPVVAGTSGWPPPAAAAKGSAAGTTMPPPPRPEPEPLPWTLDLPAIQPLPGVPAITPRSPLELLGTGAAGGSPGEAVAVEPRAPGGSAAGAGAGAAPAAAEAALPDVGATATPLDTAPGRVIDPLEHLLATLPPLEDLAVPSAASTERGPTAAGTLPEGAATSAPVAGARLPGPAPTFSAFDLRAPRRRPRGLLLALVAAVCAVALAAYLLRDAVLGWIEQRDAAAMAPRPAAGPALGADVPTGGPRRHPRRPGLPQSAEGAPMKSTAEGAPVKNLAAGAPMKSNAAGAPANNIAAGAPRSSAAGGKSTATGAAAQQAAAGAPGQGITAATPGSGLATDGAGSPAAPGGSPGPPPLVTARAGTLPGAGPGTSGAGSTAAGPALTAVERITWEATRGGTDVVIWGNGEFPPQAYSRTRVGGVAGLPAREVFRLVGIARPFPRSQLAVHSAEVSQIRTGYHANQELHVVFDLTDREIRVAGVETGPRQLRIHLVGR
jgi:uncharacterized protein (TIGR02266 family)